MIKVNEVMTTELVSLSSNDTVARASKLMAEGDFRHIPVVDSDHRLIGLVSHRDILRDGISMLNENHEKKQDLFEKCTRLAEIMTANVSAVHPNESLRSVGLLMQKHRYGCLPVVKDEKLVGIITDTDFVSIAIDLIEAQDYEEDSVMDTID